MSDLTLKDAQAIAVATLKTARDKSFKPMAVVVYDSRAALRAVLMEDGASIRRPEIAMGKAYGALALGVGSRAVNKMAVDRPFFIAGVTSAIGGQMVPVPGGVLIKNSQGEILGAVGVSGDNSDNDEAAAAGGIEASGFISDTGA